MAKTQASILIKRDLTVGNEDKFVEYLFFDKNSAQLQTIAAEIIRHLRSHGHLAVDNTILTPGNRKSYYTALARLKALGLIEKKDNRYIVIQKFPRNLTKLSEYAEDIYNDASKAGKS